MNRMRFLAIALTASALARPVYAAPGIIPGIEGTLPLIVIGVFGILAVALVVRLGEKYLS